MNAEIARIISAVGGATAIFVIDTRSDRVELRLHRRRPWVRGGFSSSVVQAVSPSDADTVLRRVAGYAPIPVAVIVQSHDPAWSVFSERLAASHDAAARVVQVVARDGRLLVDAVPVTGGFDLDWTASTLLSLTARNQLMARNVDFPVAVQLALRHATSPMNLVGLRAESPFEQTGMRLPDPLWLRVTGEASGEVTLVVDVEPGEDGDRWRWRVEGRGGPSSCAAVPPPAPCRQLRRVALVVDRTCPDWERWSDALRLAKGLHPDGAAIGDFNLGIRRGIQDAMTQYAWPAGAGGYLTWFADVPGDGLAPLDGAPAVTDGWGTYGEVVLPDGLGQALDGLTYLPGFDVWDPLEECLFEALAFFRRAPGGTLIIVGNSPPRVAAIDGPFRDVAATFGFQTSWRSESTRWDEALHELIGLGVNVEYVFLLLGARLPGEESDFQRFDAMQRRVRAALEKSLDHPVIVAPAKAGDVQRAVEIALERAQARSAPSNVEVLDARPA